MKLTAKDFIRLKDIWMADWHTFKEPAGGNTERWYNTVMQFHAERGDELFPGELRRREESIMQSGLAQEYLAALLDTVYTDGARSEQDTAILILTATVEERTQALNKIGAK